MTALSLRARLGLAGAVAVVIALAVAAVGLAQVFGTHVERRALAEMQVQLDQVLAGLARQDGDLALAATPADPRFALPYGGLYWQIEVGGVLLRSRSLWDVELALPPDLLRDGEEHRHHLTGPEGADLLVLERTVTLPAGLGGGTARAAVAMETAELVAAKRAFVTDIVPYLALLGLALIAAQWMQGAVGLSPLRRIGSRVAALRQARATRMGDDWPREVQPLAAELDALLAMREAHVEKARTRAGDLAHGLKTPLQALMGEAARLRAKGEQAAAEGIEEIARTMRAHVDRELARTRTAARARSARADAATVARRVVSVLERTPEGQRLSWRIDIPPGLALAIDAADLAEALGALAENAARYARARVTLSAAVETSRATLSITDDGPGLPEGQRATMRARGARADESGPGAGLGLAIATEIAEAAGGALWLDNTDGGRGPGLVARLALHKA
ncbi:hypothetical protein CCR83_05820 [Rhodobacter veldkampii DSM 11550]|uniref:histidine kinase n=1 Tax=Phaeovulum veldkampii DSM 11550 TaxID=1185920 RepID=A0A2T4JLZ2_9RHOB|nr:HAMP domain-containing sensor histidine kinase [Phaeovulum veldkampii]MBK5945981.1 hypothetical protein [Phaeovulum veldkampii DSM 11550]PTE18898.1 sensor histidine kinase [Phaeovulum veldkampii DSM 11550]TDQ64623.1 signal transduction histidine kinase [Phaeovulum veldkampii DSM 11550]